MLYKALVTFTGKVSMASGEVGEISDLALVEGLKQAGYIEEYQPEKPAKRARKS